MLYAAFDNHKNGDLKPYLLKSTDKGSTWTSITTNLPANGPVLAVAEDHVDPKLLFVGTEFGAYFSNDGGKKWIKFKSLPTIAVRDIAIQKRENDLVLATFGRGFWILDDYSALRSLPQSIGQKAALFPVKDAKLYIEERNNGSKKGHLGESFYQADNPPFGATFTFYQKEKLKSLKDVRQDKEKKAEKASGNAKLSGPYASMQYPTAEELRAEAEEQAPALWLTISDAKGNVVRQISAPNAAGINRATWDLRMPNSRLREADKPAPADDDDDDPGSRDSSGLVAPGTYQVTLSQNVRGQWTNLAGPVKFSVGLLDAETAKMSPEDIVALAQFQQKLMGIQRTVYGASQQASNTEHALQALEKALRQTPADVAPLITRLLQLQDRNNVVLTKLIGDRVSQKREDLLPKSISDRVSQISADEYLSTSKPTGSHLASYKETSEELTSVLNDMRAIDTDFKALQSEAEKAGAPYTPGRGVPMLQ